MTSTTTTADPADATAREIAGLASDAGFAWSPDAKRMGGLTRWLVFALWFNVVAMAAGMAFYATQAFTPYSLDALDTDGELSQIMIGIAFLAMAVGVLIVGATIACVVLVCRFVYRAARNLEKSKARGIEISAGWAVGWYFIPFANLVKPFQSMKEIWISSHDPEHGFADAPRILAWWWGAWITGSFISSAGNAISNQAARSGSAETLQISYMVDGLSCFPSIIASLCLISIVRQIAKAQDRQFDISAF